MSSPLFVDFVYRLFGRLIAAPGLTGSFGSPNSGSRNVKLSFIVIEKIRHFAAARNFTGRVFR
jgi:hypothetical protein